MSPNDYRQQAGAHATPHDPEPFTVSAGEFWARVTLFFRAWAHESVVHDCRKQYHLIRRSLDHFWPYLGDEYFFDMYLEIVFSLFEAFHVKTSCVVRKVLEVYTLRKLRSYSPKLLQQRQPSEREFRLFNVPDNLDPPFDQCLSIQAVHHPFLMQDLEATQRLLRYGARFEMTPDSLSRSLVSLFRCLTRTIMPVTFREVVVVSDFGKIAAVYPTFHEQRRLYFGLVALHAIVLRNIFFSRSKERIDSIKMVFKTLQEPFFTVSEITRFLNLCLTGETKERDIKQICENFIKDFPRSTHSFAPRSLKHLCRCTVRQSLTKSGQLPHGVLELDIPLKLKDYLLLQRYQSEFHPRYVAALSTVRESLSDLPASSRQGTT